MTIVDVTERQIPQIAALERRCFSLPWTEAMLRTQLAEDHVFLCAVEGDAVLGYVGMQTVLDEGYISNIAVSPERRREGIADALLCALKERGNALAFLTLEVRESNAAAIALYTKHGFQVAGRRKKYYQKPAEDAILMTWKPKE